MTENKRFRYYEHKGADYILDNPNTELDFIEMLGDCLKAEEIVNLLNEQDKIIKEKENLIRAKNKQIEDIKRILTEHYEYCKEKCEEYQTNIVIYSVYDLLRYSFKQILNDLGWD